LKIVARRQIARGDRASEATRFTVATGASGTADSRWHLGT